MKMTTVSADSKDLKLARQLEISLSETFREALKLKLEKKQPAPDKLLRAALLLLDVIVATSKKSHGPDKAAKIAKAKKYIEKTLRG